MTDKAAPAPSAIPLASAPAPAGTASSGTASAAEDYAGPYVGPVKHSITIEGHQTSISLEPVFWAALRRAAVEEGLPLSTLVARIDEERLAAWNAAIHGHGARAAPPANLASALRIWLWTRQGAAR